MAEISSPDGDRWEVSRQWVKGPKFRWGLRRKPELDDLSALEFTPFDVMDSPSGILFAITLVIALAVFAAVTAFVILPLMGLALEFAVAFVLLGYGIATRVLFRRPWVIEVKNLDNPLHSRDFKVAGWARSREAIAEIKQLIASGAELDSPSVTALTSPSV